MLTVNQVQAIQAAYPEACSVVDSNVACAKDCGGSFESAQENAFCHPALKALDDGAWHDVSCYLYHVWEN